MVLAYYQRELLNDKIFEYGYRGKLSADRHRTGSGMGLSEVKKIIKKHNGKVKIMSDPKGSAYKTVVKVFLPYEKKRRNRWLILYG